MTRLFILDDEMMIRQGIRYAINWEEHDIVVCGEASNGRAALRSLPSCNPDVIIADIQMPQMDGFSFLEKAREILPHIKVIILTGYSSHDYMAQAIRCGAFDYLEKPAESEAILSSVLKAQCQIQLEQSDAQRSEDVMQLFNATGNLSRAWLIQNLFTIGLEEDFCCRIGRMLGLPLGNGTRYHLLLFRPVEKEIWPLLTALADQFHTHMLRHLISMGLVGGFVDVTLSPEEITRRLGCISGLKNMCVGPIWAMLDIDPLLEGARAFALVSQRLERSYAFASGEIHFLSLQDEEENTAALLDHGALLDRMDRAGFSAEKRQYDDALNLFEEALTLLAHERADNQTFYYYSKQILLRAAHAVRRDDLLTELIVFSDSMPSEEDVRMNLRELLKPESAGVLAESLIIENAVFYLKKHYAEPLSVTSMASRSFLSPAYFGRLFKRELNMSFSSYLTLFRVQQAKTLLRETRMRNYEIATAVGFSSYKLFAQCFQKLAGISASEYRTKYSVFND